MVPISIKMWNGKARTIQITKTDTINEIKRKLHEGGLPKHTQWMLSGRRVEPHETMGEIKIKANDQLIQYKDDRGGQGQRKSILSRRKVVASRRIKMAVNTVGEKEKVGKEVMKGDRK